MTVSQLLSLFETSEWMNWVLLFFFFNFGITLLEVVVDLASKKQRRWFDTLSNVAIFFLGQLTERFLFGSLGILALLPIYYLIPYEIPMTW